MDLSSLNLIQRLNVGFKLISLNIGLKIQIPKKNVKIQISKIRLIYIFSNKPENPIIPLHNVLHAAVNG